MKSKLYTIQEKGYAEEILTKGFVLPMDLCEEDCLAQHLMHVGLEDPAILEIDVEGLSNTFHETYLDEDERPTCMPLYKTYFTDSPIPAGHISKVEFTEDNKLGQTVYSGIMAMKENAASVGEMNEISNGLRKCVNLGICSEDQFDTEIKTITAMIRGGYFDAADDFSKAVASISGPENVFKLPDR